MLLFPAFHQFIIVCAGTLVILHHVQILVSIQSFALPHETTFLKFSPLLVGAELVQFVPSEVMTFPEVQGVAYVSVEATKVVPLFFKIVPVVVPELVITRTHSTATTQADTLESVVSEA